MRDVWRGGREKQSVRVRDRSEKGIRFTPNKKGTSACAVCSAHTRRFGAAHTLHSRLYAAACQPATPAKQNEKPMPPLDALEGGPVPLAPLRDDARRTLIDLLDAVSRRV